MNTLELGLGSGVDVEMLAGSSAGGAWSEMFAGWRAGDLTVAGSAVVMPTAVVLLVDGTRLAARYPSRVGVLVLMAERRSFFSLPVNLSPGRLAGDFAGDLLAFLAGPGEAGGGMELRCPGLLDLSRGEDICGPRRLRTSFLPRLVPAPSFTWLPCPLALELELECQVWLRLLRIVMLRPGTKSVLSRLLPEELRLERSFWRRCSTARRSWRCMRLR